LKVKRRAESLVEFLVNNYNIEENRTVIIFSFSRVFLQNQNPQFSFMLTNFNKLLKIIIVNETEKNIARNPHRSAVYPIIGAAMTINIVLN
jgi:hypothetical protein